MGLDLMKGINIKYSEEGIKNLSKKLNWKGAGTETDPLIIPNKEGLPQKFAFIKSRFFIKIINCSIEQLVFSDCQNISIENSSFEVLKFVFSQHNLVVNSSITRLSLNFSFNNTFNTCTIVKATNLDSNDNAFNDCTLNDKVKKKLEKDFFSLSSYIKPLFFGIIATGILTLLFPVTFFLTPFFLLTEWIFMICIFFGIVILYLIALKIEGKFSQNDRQNKINSN